MDERNNRRERYRNVIDLAPDSVDKTLSQLGIDFATDPLTWLPGTDYAKAVDAAHLSAKVGRAVGGNAPKAAKADEALAPLAAAKTRPGNFAASLGRRQKRGPGIS